MKRIQTDTWFFGLLGLFLLISVIGLRDWNSRFERPINGDGKGYYAYLPAIFIYHDSQFGFIEEIEQKYYPKDRSHFKDFLNEQPNGRVVNKTFPGLSILYAPFFFVAWLIAWLAGFAGDGYSLPFQMGIAIAHVVYLMLGLRTLYLSLRSLGAGEKTALMLIFISLFGTNVWYYTVYDHSVGHVFSFFLCSLFVWNTIVFFKLKLPFHFSTALVILALMTSIRPTNALLVLFVPLLLRISGGILLSDLRMYWRSLFKQWLVVPLCSVILSMLPILWYWQTGDFLVYSYGKESFDFSNPHLWEFLFSYQKGWLLWSPFIAVMGLFIILIYIRKDLLLLCYFLIPFILIIYILSSWWCWTYGDGFGQRPMIEFIPLITLVFGAAIQRISRNWRVVIVSLCTPFIGLSLFQGFQVHAGIIRGGATTQETYWSHFLQWYKDAPKAKIPEGCRLVYVKEIGRSDLSAKKAYSRSLVLPVKGVSILKMNVVMSGAHKDTNVRIVLSSKDASYYKSEFTGMYIYNFDRSMSYLFSIEKCQEDTLYAYVWNGDTNSKVYVRSIKAMAYSKK